MTAITLDKRLASIGMNRSDLCRAIYFETGVAIAPSSIKKQLTEAGRLSAPLSAAVILFLKAKEAKDG